MIKVLVVEDDLIMLDVICEKITMSNMKAIKCESGDAAVAYLTSTDELPDIIWLDYYLKDMNGLQFMQEIEKNEKLKQIPIVVISNSASPDIVHHMLAMGATKYLLKSENKLEDLILHIKDLTRLENVS